MAYVNKSDIYKMFDESNGVIKLHIADVDMLPTADVVEVKHGEWIPIVIQDGYYEPPYCDTIKCSECGALEDVSLHDAKYCHMCGAKMDGKDINVTTTRGNENVNKQ